MSKNELTTTTQQGGAMSVYSRINDPMAAVAALGKAFAQSKIIGVQTPGDGEVVALTCMCEGITPMEFARTYHIVSGRPTMRADAMLAKFRTSGGKCKWTKTGDDGQAAEAEWTYDGQTLTIGYTIQDADKAGLIKPGGNWDKDPGSMLRARCITKAVRMLAPELIAGTYTPEEVHDFAEQQQRSDADIEARRQELQRMSHAETAPTIDAEAEPIESAPTKQEAAPPADPPADKEPSLPAAELATESQLTAIIETAAQLGIDKSVLAEKIKQNCNVTDPHNISCAQAAKLLVNLEAKLVEKRRLDNGGVPF